MLPTLVFDEFAVPENLLQNLSLSAENHENPSVAKTICSSNGANLPKLTIQKDEIEEFKKSEPLTFSNNSEQNASSFAKNHDNLVAIAGKTIRSRNDVNFPE